MRLTFQVRSYCEQPPTDPQVRSFDSFPVIVGRSNACDYCLQDASRYISSNHALILLEGDQLLIQDTSANGVYVNGASEPVGRGRTLVLHDADSLAIGDYQLNVSIDRTSSTPEAADDPFANLHSGASNSNPPAAPPDYDPFHGDEPDWTPPSQAEDPFGDDWEINDRPQQGSLDTQGTRTGTSDSDWADWTDHHPDAHSRNAAEPDRKGKASQPARPAQGAADDDFDWLPGTTSETVSLPAAFPGQDNPAESHRSGSGQVARPGNPSGRSQSAPARQQRPDGVANASLRGAQPPHASHAERRPGDSTALLDVLLHAASLRESDLAHLDDEQILEQTGKLLAQLVDAIMILLQSRTELKNAMRSDVTTLSRSGNNPLKFSFSSADALTKLLANDTNGYLQSDRAVQEAVDDLKLHQLAMLDGMKSAVRSLLFQFDPGKLAKKLEKTGGISANIPISREAKLWQLFCEQYDAIQEEAVNDFGELFGTEFRKAYEKRIRKMGRSPDF